MRSGELRHVIDIEQLEGTAVRGSRGQTQRTWKPLVTKHAASIVTLSGREAEQARQLVPTASHRIGCRYVPGVTEKMRVKFGSRYFYIGQVDNKMERNIELGMIVTESKA